MVCLGLRLRVGDRHDEVPIHRLDLPALDAVQDPFKRVDVARVVQFRVWLLFRKALFETSRVGNFDWDHAELIGEALDDVSHLAPTCKN